MKSLKLALIGCGGRSSLADEMHLPQAGSMIACAADVDPAARQNYADTFQRKFDQRPKMYASYAEMLEKESPDGVVILSPDYLHAEHACLALSRKIPVYLEKPMAITVDDCDRILQTAKNNRVHLMIGHNMRYMRFTRKIKELIDSGVIGEVRSIWCRHFVSYGGYAYFTRWMSEEDKVNSLLLQKGSHDIDIIHWFGGAYSAAAVGMGSLSVYDRCHRRNPGEPRPRIGNAVWPPASWRDMNPVINVNDHNMLLLTLGNGVQAALLECFYTPDSCRNYTVIGTRGRLENYGDTHGRTTVEVWNQYNSETCFRLTGDLSFDVSPPPDIGHGGSDALIAREFIEYLQGRATPVITPQDSRAAVAAGCAGADSMRTGACPVRIKPLSEELAAWNF